MDTQRIRQLLDQRDAIDRELTQLITGNAAPANKKAVRCSSCGEEGHTARNCPSKTAPPPQEYQNGAATY